MIKIDELEGRVPTSRTTGQLSRAACLGTEASGEAALTVSEGKIYRITPGRTMRICSEDRQLRKAERNKPSQTARITEFACRPRASIQPS